MTKKQLKIMLVFMVISSPSLLLLNESNTIIPNIVGAVYMLFITILVKTDIGENIINIIKNFINK